jgi:hypothetical protein
MAEDTFEFAQGWVDDQEQVGVVVAEQEFKSFSETEAGKFMTYALPENVYLWDAAKKVLGTLLPDRNQGSVGSCFPAGTKVRMADGSYKNIEDVKTRDMVLTAEGNAKRVLTTFLRREASKLMAFKCHGHYGLKATEEHPVLTKRGYVKMADLTTDDYVAVPKYSPCKRELINTEEYMEWYVEVKREHNQITYAGAEKSFGRRSCVAQTGPMPTSISLNKDFGKVIGLFLAEGCTDNRKTVWTFNINEADTLAKALIEAVTSVFGVTPTLSLKERTNTCKVTLHGTNFAMLFKKLCGNGAGLKRMHQHLTEGPKEFLQSVFEAWLSGDGHVKEGTTQGTTVSHELALNMFDIANMLGLSPSIRYFDPKISHGVKTRKRRYDVVFATGDGYRPDQTDKVMWRKITSLSSVPYSGDVFNFEVEDDNSYVVECIGVHNCVSFGCIRAIEYTYLCEIAAGEDEEFRHLCQEINYAGGRVEVGKGRLGRGDGSIGAWSAEFAKRWGSLDRGVYGKYDLTKYDTDRCRAWGRTGVPDDLEPEVKKYSITTITLVKTIDELKKALAAGYGVSVASNQGFSMTRDSNGIAKASGSWAHQMCICGYATIGGKLYFRIDNSWGAAAHRGPVGPGDPSTGGFYADERTVARMLAQNDSWAYAGQNGFKPRDILDWFV